MPAAESPLPEFDQEMATTRRLLERVPSGHGAWKPHPKSFSLGHLAQLVSRMPAWIASTLGEDAMDLATNPGYSLEPTETLLRAFDANVRAAREAMAACTPERLVTHWQLRHGANVLISAPRGAMARTHLLHLVHHRGQLSVYLRLLDVPLPSIYGPTADERG